MVPIVVPIVIPIVVPVYTQLSVPVPKNIVKKYIQNNLEEFERIIKISTDIRTIFVYTLFSTQIVEIYRYFHANYGLNEIIIDIVVCSKAFF